MNGNPGFYEEVERMAALRSHGIAEDVADRVLAVLARHLLPGQSLELSKFLPRRAAVAIARSPVQRELALDADALIQEVAVSTHTVDPNEALAYLGAVLASLRVQLPPAQVGRLLAELPAAERAMEHGRHPCCLLCSPLPWPAGTLR